VSTHYEILGVAPSATVDEIRRAYHAQARRWHPDHAGDRSGVEAGRSEDAIRRINEAWRVLGDTSRRRDYDRTLVRGQATATSGAGGAWAPTAQPGPRIDPRLFDPEYVAARRRQQFEQIDKRQAVALRVVPIVAFLALLVGIFVVTAYARPGTDQASPPTTMPGPPIGVAAGTCVRIGTGPSLLPVPCEAGRDGVVVGARLEGPDSTCPARTAREVTLPNGAIVCLAP
jgi:hypothetical protein